MSTNSLLNDVGAGSTCDRQRVSISAWVNEPYPAWDRILTAHDVARLIRRPPWILSSLAAVGKFPKKLRFRGKKIGWLKADILEWMARTSRYRVVKTSDMPNFCHVRRPDSPNALTPPIRCASSPARIGHETVSSLAGVAP